MATVAQVDGGDSQLEFLTIFRLLYGAHPLLLASFFLALLLACLSVISLLTFRSMVQSEPKNLLAIRAGGRHTSSKLSNLRKVFFFYDQSKTYSLNAVSA